MKSDTCVLQLASKSPRRRELLEQIGVSYCVVESTIDETQKPNERAESLVVRLAKEKACAGFDASPKCATMGSDTIVVLDGEVFGKPKDKEDSARMLRALSGKSHSVISAVAIFDGQRCEAVTSVSEVHFGVLTDEDIDRYWHTGEPKDKAGSYGIQGLGAVFVTELRGSYSGVMGLPVTETAALLDRFNIAYWRVKDKGSV